MAELMLFAGSTGTLILKYFDIFCRARIALQPGHGDTGGAHARGQSRRGIAFVWLCTNM